MIDLYRGLGLGVVKPVGQGERTHQPFACGIGIGWADQMQPPRPAQAAAKGQPRRAANIVEQTIAQPHFQRRHIALDHGG